MKDIFALDDDVMFTMRLAETIAWCQARVQLTDIEHSLRSATLQPTHELQFAWCFRHSLYVNTVLRTRENALKLSLAPVTTRYQLLGGRLLFYFPDEQVDDGASEVYSKGFFDSQDAPAWDCWVGSFLDDKRGQYIVSWVPATLIEIAAEGLAVNMVDCIGWLEDVKSPLSLQLKEFGLI